MSGTDLPTQEISDEEKVRRLIGGALVAASNELDVDDLTQWHPCEPTCGKCACSGIPYVSDRLWELLKPALVASGYRREADVLREQADRRHCIDRSRLPMTVFGGVQIPYCICGMPWHENGCTPRQQLILEAAERDRATALEQAQPLLAAGSEVESLELVDSPLIDMGYMSLPVEIQAEAEEEARLVAAARVDAMRKAGYPVDCMCPACASARAEIEGRRTSEGQERSEEKEHG